MTWRLKQIIHGHDEIVFQFENPDAADGETRHARWESSTRTWLDIIPETVEPFLAMLSAEDQAKVLAAQMREM